MIKPRLSYSFFLFLPDPDCLNYFSLPAPPSLLGFTEDEVHGSAVLHINKRTQRSSV